MPIPFLKWCAPVALGVVCSIGHAGYTNPYSGVLVVGSEFTAPTVADLATLTGFETTFRSTLASAGTVVDFETAGAFWAIGGGLTATMNGGDRQNCDSTGFASCDGRYSIVPTKAAPNEGDPASSWYWQGGWDPDPNNASNNSFTVEFNQAVAALGFYLVDVGDHGASLKLEFLDGNGVLLGSYDVAQTADTETGRQGSVQFLSFVSDSVGFDFRKVRFTSTGLPCPLPDPNDTGPQICNTGDAFGLDRITAATRTPDDRVPEPATLLLALGALAGAGGARRLRRRI